MAASSAFSANITSNVDIASLSKAQLINLYKTARANNDDKTCLQLLPFINQALGLKINTENFNTTEMQVEEKKRSPVFVQKNKIEIRPYREINSITAISADEIMGAHGTTIVFWDLDFTLVRPKYLISNISPEERKVFINKFTHGSLEDVNHKDHAFAQEFLKFLNTDNRFMEVVRIEYANQELMQELHQRGALIVGLTARKKEAAAFSDWSLRKLGIDFMKLSNLGDYLLDFDENAALINGIFYTGHSDDKVTFIPDLASDICRQLGKAGPYTVWHFDDNEKEIHAFSKCDPSNYETEDDYIITPVYSRTHDIMLALLQQNMQFLEQEVAELYQVFCSQIASLNDFTRKLSDS